jgi:hypothetical protein
MPAARDRPALSVICAVMPGRAAEASRKNEKRGPSPGRRVGLGPTLGQRLM